MDHKEQFETVGDGLLVRAPAKINLSLLVAGKRPDGFHNLETVMAKVNYYDEILIEANPENDLALVCEGPEWAPDGPENLVYKAARLLLNACGESADIKLTLTKNIPAGSGLGSASSDAAATLLGLNEYLELGLPRRQLAKLASKLGSDVAFFLDGPLAFCTRKGEKIRKIRKKFPFLAVLALPAVSISTQKVYANYVHDQALFETLSETINGHIGNNRIDLAAKKCANMLEKYCFGLEGELAELKAEIESLCAMPCCLSGSGSAMFCIVENADMEKASELRSQIQAKTGCKSIIVTANRW
ncbi:MAG: 4-(cytidine 5'-diphospho)-2-C-methyl-D-erythritol kinase [Sedimentisphaerales bacterium]|nr:4-(cytidine 5'-diphospho)-2-C-methyl-D-erythritol kinase [Sedimentisphaerales bacterium]